MRLANAEQLLQSLLAKFGPKARTYRDLGLCAIREGAYADAVGFLKEARRLGPADAPAGRALNEAMEKLKVARAVMDETPSLPGVLMAEPLSKAGDWAVLTGTDHTDYFETKIGVMVDIGERRTHLALRLVRFADGRATTRWASPEIRCDQTRVFSEATLFVHDLAGDGKPEFGVWATFYGADHEPSVFVAYRPSPSVREVARIVGNSFLRAEEVSGDHRIQVRTAQIFGLNLIVAEAPVWFDVYEPMDGRYLLVNRKFRSRYIRLEKEIRADLRKTGPDPDLELHLARIEGMFDRRPEAERLLDRADRDLNRVIDLGARGGASGDPWLVRLKLEIARAHQDLARSTLQ